MPENKININFTVTYQSSIYIPNDPEVLEALNQSPVLRPLQKDPNKHRLQIRDLVCDYLRESVQLKDSDHLQITVNSGRFVAGEVLKTRLAEIKPDFYFEYFGGAIEFNPTHVSNILAEFTYKGRKFIYYFCAVPEEPYNELTMYDDAGDVMEPDALYHELKALNVFDHDSLQFLANDNQEELREA